MPKSTPNPRVRPTTRTRLAFHEGEVLLRLAAIYNNLHRTMLEMIQNAIDANAKRVFVKIDLDRRDAMVIDDGEGISEEKFQEALHSVGHSVKPKKGTIGQFGLGLISPLNKVKTYEVLSIPRGSLVGHQWTFDPAKIKDTAERLTIPVREIDRLPSFETPWNQTVNWRTMIKLVGITRDRVTTLINLDDLEGDILNGFGQVMRIKGTTCVVELTENGKSKARSIKPRDYDGIPFKEVTLHGDVVGEVKFTLYQAKPRNGKRTGTVSVHQTDDSFLLPWKKFLQQVRGHGWYNTSPVFEALDSGYFEGVIAAKEILLDPGRTKFVSNDQLLDLFLVIDEWFHQFGRNFLDDEKEKTAAERLQTLGLKSLERWNSLLDDDAYAHLRACLQGTFVYGRLGDGHVDPESGRVGGEQEEKSIRTGQGGAGKPRNPRDKGVTETHPRRDDEDRDPDRPGDLPLGAIGPRGQKRKLVKHDSLGLQIAHEPIDSTRLWELDSSRGILYFNTSHRLWERCESKDAWVLQLQEWVIMTVLHLLLFPAEQFEMMRELPDQTAKCHVEQFICTSPPKRR